jgi:hypothetical protein
MKSSCCMLEHWLWLLEAMDVDQAATGSDDGELA